MTIRVAFLVGAAAACSAACTGEGRPSADVGEPAPILHLADGGSPGSVTEGSAPLREAGSMEGSAPEGGSSDASFDASAEASSDGPSDAPSTEAADVVVDAPTAKPRCDPSHSWIDAGSTALTTTAFNRFGGVSGDELTIAWTTSNGAIYVADRSAATSAFLTGTTVPTGTLAVAPGRVALNSAGTVLVGVASNGMSLVAWERSGHGTAWTPADTSEFVNINAMGGDPGNGSFSEPAFGFEGASLFYLVQPINGPPALFESRWDTSLRVWQTGLPITGADFLSADANRRRRPTGASSDGLTLFFYDEAAQSERAAWRVSLGSAFATFVDLPFPEASPNDRCDALYYQDKEASPTAIDSTR